MMPDQNVVDSNNGSLVANDKNRTFGVKHRLSTRRQGNIRWIFVNGFVCEKWRLVLKCEEYFLVNNAVNK